MNTRILSLVSLGAAAVVMTGCTTSPPPVTAWEYKIVDPSQNREQTLNTLGGDGWILVGADPHAGYVLKRAKQ